MSNQAESMHGIVIDPLSTFSVQFSLTWIGTEPLAVSCNMYQRSMQADDMTVFCASITYLAVDNFVYKLKSRESVCGIRSVFWLRQHDLSRNQETSGY